MDKYFTKKAVTLAEILLVFFIIGIVASVVINNIRSTTEEASNVNFTYSIYNTLRTAVADHRLTGNNMGTWTSNGQNLCNALEDRLSTVPIRNISGGALVTNCSTGNVTTGFNSVNPNLILSNGARIYNSDMTPVSGMYNIYVDIDGNRRNGTLDNDVIQFTVNASTGEVLPAFNSVAATSVNYLSASYRRYDNASSSWVWVAQNIPFRTAACESGVVTGTFCSSSPIINQANPTCTANSCEMVVNKPNGL